MTKNKLPDPYEEVVFNDDGCRYQACFFKRGEKQTSKIYYAFSADKLIDGMVEKDKYPFNIRIRCTGEDKVGVAKTRVDMENMMMQSLGTEYLRIKGGILYGGK